MGLENISAITLDLYGTTLDVESSVVGAFSRFLREKEFTGSPVALVRSWMSAYFQETLIDTLLAHGRTPFERIVRDALSQVLSQAGVNHAPQDLERLLASRDEGSFYPDVPPGLETLKSAYTVAVLSNGDQASLERVVGNLAMPADRVMSAEQAGVYKPHPKVYEMGLEALGLGKDQVLHVAAHSWDIRGARAFGIHGAYINRAGVPFGGSPFQPDLEVASFVDLAAALGGARQP